MASKYSHKTPSRALTLAEMNIGVASTSKLQGNDRSQSSARAKRLVDLISESSSTKKLFDSTQYPTTGKYTTFKIPKSCGKNFSTTKKQVKLPRLENTAVRRTINFLPTNHVDSNQKMSTASYRKRSNLMKEDNLLMRSNKKSTSNNKTATEIHSQLQVKVVSLENLKPQPRIVVEAFEHQRSIDNLKDDMGMTLFTQYRDINDSFDVSSCEKSPMNNIDINDSIKDTPTKPADLSDSICDLMNKAGLTSNYPDISKYLLEIRDQLQENINMGRKRKALIVIELKKNQKCVDNVNEILKLVSDNKTQLANTKQRGISSGAQAKQMVLRSRFNVATPKKFDVDAPYKSLRISNSPKMKTPQTYGSGDLRKRALLNTLDKANCNIENVTPTKKEKKSLKMLTSLKNSSNFLKTPNDKKKANVSLETPISKSRNMTMANIKEQLERLYDE